MKKFLSIFLFITALVSMAKAQQAEVTISLNEQFFDALLDAIFKNADPPEFPLASNKTNVRLSSGSALVAAKDMPMLFNENRSFTLLNSPTKKQCREAIRLQREIDGVRTAVRFRDGQIYAPIAFAGNYNPPLVGCIGFSGWAETNINLEFDQNGQRLIGRARVTNVSLSGTGGIGGSLLTRLVQSAIDKRVNPIQILQTDKISFVVPLQNSGSLRMKAVGIKPEIINGALNVRVVYEFTK